MTAWADSQRAKVQMFQKWVGIVKSTYPVSIPPSDRWDWQKGDETPLDTEKELEPNLGPDSLWNIFPLYFLG